ncbi:MAG: TIR domain-containing protein [Haliscomenobacteraceae bacterium CHB4]|nr:TIR domain-containing protein [Haliscomenobacteraceae bacterium CHB4]
MQMISAGNGATFAQMKAIHLVLSAGGARTFTYVGAIRALQREGIEIRSVSCCSAGTAIGALLAARMDFDEIIRFLRQKPLKQYLQQKTGWLPFQYLFRYPYAKYRQPGLPALFTLLHGKDVRLGELAIPFATVGLDIVNDRFIVFSDETHPDMFVSEAISIGAAVPGMYPPHERDQRIIVDAAVSTFSPVWLAARHADDCPIVVLKPLAHEDFRFTRNVLGFIGELFHAGAAARDWYNMQSDPRVRVVEMNFDNVRVDDFALSTAQLNRLFFNGEHAIQNALPYLWQQPDRTAAPADAKTLSGDDLGEYQATAMIQRYRALLGKKRNRIFIGYSDEDENWLDRLIVMLKPFLHKTGMNIWSNKSLHAGDTVESEVQAALDSAKVAVLLVSPDFLAEDSSWKQEIPYCIEAARRGELELLWIPVRASAYQDTELAQFRPARDPEQALAGLEADEQDTALLDVVQRIKEALLR